MVSSGIETVCCNVMASCYEESSNFSAVVTFKFEIKKNHKRNNIGLKHVYLQASSLNGLFCTEHFAT